MAAGLRVPDHYDLVEGDTFELFRRGIVEANDPYRYNWRVECEKGAIFRRKYVYTPKAGDAGVWPMVMTLEDEYGISIELEEGIATVQDLVKLINERIAG